MPVPQHKEVAPSGAAPGELTLTTKTSKFSKLVSWRIVRAAFEQGMITPQEAPKPEERPGRSCGSQNGRGNAVLAVPAALIWRRWPW